jgi:hypothetical protein
VFFAAITYRLRQSDGWTLSAAVASASVSTLNHYDTMFSKTRTSAKGSRGETARSTPVATEGAELIGVVQ